MGFGLFPSLEGPRCWVHFVIFSATTHRKSLIRRRWATCCRHHWCLAGNETVIVLGEQVGEQGSKAQVTEAIHLRRSDLTAYCSSTCSRVPPQSKKRLVLPRMGSNKPQTDERPPVKPASGVSFCLRNKSENGSFISNLRSQFHEFIHASIDEHKTCLRDTMQKMLNASKNFGKNGDSPNEGENSLPLRSSTRN